MIPIRSNTARGWSPASEGDGIYTDAPPTARHITRDGASGTITTARGGSARSSPSPPCASATCPRGRLGG